jgi:hypothetical protein
MVLHRPVELARLTGHLPYHYATCRETKKTGEIMWLIKGTLLGAVIFVIFLFVALYQRLRHGLSTTLSDLPLNDLIFGWCFLCASRQVALFA